MDRTRTNGRAPQRDSPSPRRPAPPEPTHPLLSLQQQAGNRAVLAALRTKAGPAGPLLTLQRQFGNGAAAAGRPAVQREVLEAPQVGNAPAQAGADGQLEAVVAQQVAALAEVDEGAIPAPEQVEEARDEAAGAGAELGELGLAGDGPLAEWYGRQIGGRQIGGDEGAAAAAAPAVAELQAAPAEVEAPPAARPSRGARARAALSGAAGWLRTKLGGAASWAGEAATGVKSWFRRTFSRENRRDAGPMAQAVGGVAAPVAGHASGVLFVGQQVVENPATAGAAQFVAGASGAERVHHTGQQLGSLSSAAQPTSATLEHPAGFAHAFAAGGFELAHMVASVVGIFFSSIKAALDLRSVLSTVRVLKGLRDAERAAVEAGADPLVVEAVKYAIHQKYEKLVKRALGATVALATLGAGLAVLIANPAGAALAAVILGGVGAGFFLYKLGRWAWKKWKTKTLGVKRKEMARALFNHLRLGDQLAVAAVRSLHLDPDAIALAPHGAALIERKLKSA